MSKIQKIDLNLSNKIINPFKTSRKSSSNPFKYQDFEGNTLDVSAFADVFEGSKSNTSKLKLITSSVMGSMTKLHRSITEPIVNFVKRIGSTISGAWEYAKNTNVSDFGTFKPITDFMNTDIADIGRGIGHTISEGISFLNTDISVIGKGISGKISSLNCELTDIGKNLSSSWTELVNSINPHKSLKDKSVAELKAMWMDLNNSEIAEQTKSFKEVA